MKRKGSWEESSPHSTKLHGASLGRKYIQQHLRQLSSVLNPDRGSHGDTGVFVGGQSASWMVVVRMSRASLEMTMMSGVDFDCLPRGRCDAIHSLPEPKASWSWLSLTTCLIRGGNEVPNLQNVEATARVA